MVGGRFSCSSLSLKQNLRHEPESRQVVACFTTPGKVAQWRATPTCTSCPPDKRPTRGSSSLKSRICKRWNWPSGPLEVAAGVDRAGTRNERLVGLHRNSIVTTVRGRCRRPHTHTHTAQSLCILEGQPLTPTGPRSRHRLFRKTCQVMSREQGVGRGRSQSQ